jgi:hypothetical protein
MRHAKTRPVVLQAFEDGLVDTPKGAFIGSFSVAAVNLLLTSIASDVVPVCRRDEVDERFVLAEADALLPDGWVRTCLPSRQSSALPGVMEWRCPGLPSLFTLTSAWPRGAALRNSPGRALECSVAGYRYCDPTQARIWNGIVYRKAYRGWRPGRDLNREPVRLDTLLSLASALGMEVESSVGWTFSRWLQAQMARRSGRLRGRGTRQDVQRHATHTAA